MNNPSWRHHFIPEFYLRNFTNPEGKFYIYSVKTKEFKEKGKLYSPSSHFFKRDGNTLVLPPVAKDYLEARHYSPLDNDISKIIEKIVSSSDLRKNLTSIECVKVNYFINQLFWRNPGRDDFAKNFIAERSLEEMGIAFDGDLENRKKFETFLKSNKDFYKIIKAILPLNTHHLVLEAENNFEILKLEQLHGGALLGDSPVIFRKRDMVDTYREEMIVPLASNMFFVRSNSQHVYFDEYLKVRLDLIQLKQANEYVCVTDCSYLERLLKLYDTHIKDDERLRQELFDGMIKLN